MFPFDRSRGQSAALTTFKRAQAEAIYPFFAFRREEEKLMQLRSGLTPYTWPLIDYPLDTSLVL